MFGVMYVGCLRKYDRRGLKLNDTKAESRRTSALALLVH